MIALFAISPAAALTAEYVVLPNGTAYNASIEVTDATSYTFAGVGLMGENVPIPAGGVGLSGNCSPACGYNWSRPWGAPSSISFPEGNYTVSYTGPLQDDNLQGVFDKPYDVNVTIPPEFDVRNPLLAGISPAANITRHADNSTTLRWNETVTFSVRFYDPGHEELLWFFLQFMGILVVVLLVIPYILSVRKTE